MIVKDEVELQELLKSGMKNRVTGATDLNEVSSRSHAVFQIFIEKLFSDPIRAAEIKDKKTKITKIQKSKLCLIDLAGSERVSKSGTKDDTLRFKEATKINLSLLSLCQVISALTSKTDKKHIPYRDSVLTRLLQDSLGGNSKTLMVSSVSPCENNYSETLSTLRYATRAKKIKN
jgi:kinesin family protein 3/17